jgi:hypothetical protein
MSLASIAIASLIISFICSAFITIDLIYHSQKMWIINMVLPLTALYAGLLGLLAYFKLGRTGGQQRKPFWQSVLTGALHCGSGCTLGDIIAVSLLLAVPVKLFGSNLYGEWAIDFLLAFFIGIAFQYYAIKPMRNLSPRAALKAAIKADTLSLTCWQIGM